MSDTITVTDNPDKSRYEAHLEGNLVGYATYQLTTALIVFTHTEVVPECEGKGVGSALAKFALDDVRDQGQRQVLLLCPFIKAWIARHPEYIPLVFGAPASNVRD